MEKIQLFECCYIFINYLSFVLNIFLLLTACFHCLRRTFLHVFHSFVHNPPSLQCYSFFPSYIVSPLVLMSVPSLSRFSPPPFFRSGYQARKPNHLILLCNFVRKFFKKSMHVYCLPSRCYDEFNCVESSLLEICHDIVVNIALNQSTMHLPTTSFERCSHCN